MDEEGQVGNVADAEGAAPGLETGMDKLGPIWHRFPNTQAARLRWIYTQLLGGTSGQNLIFAPSGSAYDQQAKRDVGSVNTYITAQQTIDAATPTFNCQTPKLIQFRMTSPYSIVKSDTAQTNLSQPQWLGFFDSKYQYYHTVKAEWQLTFSIGLNNVDVTAAQQFYGFYVYWKYTSYDDPPTQFTVDNTGKTTYIGTTLDLSPDDYDRMGGWNKIWIQAKNTKIVRRVITGHYVTGDCKMDVKMLTDGAHSATSTAEGWTSTGSTTAFPENLSVILVQDNAMTVTGATVELGIRAEIDYTIQFRDLLSK